MKNRIFSIMDTSKKKAGVVVLCVVLVATIGTGIVFAAGSANNRTVDERASDVITALEQLVDSVRYVDGELSFQIPENYPNQKAWNILISGRKEMDGFGMSVHYLTEENENKSWESGKRYTIPLKGTTENYTELWLDASLPDENGNTQTRSIDLLKIITNE
jgi:hypothetical protein